MATAFQALHSIIRFKCSLCQGEVEEGGVASGLLKSVDFLIKMQNVI